jgi:hypothetical protein
MPSVPDDWELLETFVQISDLHIGGVLDPTTGDAEISAAAAAAYSNSPWFDGLLGHHGVALEALDEFLAGLRKSGEAFRLIVTGDITRCGHFMDFSVGVKYITDSVDLRPPNLRMAGLYMKAVELVIPGNHDQWGGSFIAWGGGPSEYPNYIAAPVPHVHAPMRLRNGREIVFVSINSDSDVNALSHDRQLALGKFVPDLTNPASHPPSPPDPNDIRMMLIHHSWHQDGRILRMRTKSKEELGQFLHRHDIKAILTGHSHEPMLEWFKVPSLHVSYPELRTGTTTQLDTVPTHWRNLLRKVPQRDWPQNSLLVHRIYDDGANGTWWHAQIFRREEDLGFQPMSVNGSTLTFKV